MARPPAPTTSMEDRTVVITGANSGIGLETAAALATAGARIVMGCRNADTAAAAVDEVRRRCGHDRVETRSLDLADLDHVRRFAASLSDLDRIDVLINNAGLMLDQRQESAQGHEATFAINHLGPFLLTSLLTEQVVAAPRGRIVNVASFAHQLAPRGIDWADIERRRHYRGWIVYGQSKLANILHADELARRLWDRGVVAHSLHPGSVASGFGRDGDLHGFNDRLLRVGCVREHERFSANLRLSFRPHHPTGLHIRPHLSDEPPGATGQDIAVDDTAFDRTFIVRGYDPATVRALLHDRARATLLHLAALGTVQVTDRGLDLDGLATNADAVDQAIERALALADALGW